MERFWWVVCLGLSRNSCKLRGQILNGMQGFLLWAVIAPLFLVTEEAGVAVCPEPDAGPDLVICDPGDPVQINAQINGSYDRFYWEPAAGLSPANSLNPTARVNQTTTYRLVVEAKSDVNLIANGGFAAGNSGFTSEYVYRPPGPGFSWGNYSVHNRPTDLNGAWTNCGDATGDGMMLICDAATSPGLNFWCQTVAVQPNTNYEFSFQGAGVYPVSPANVVVKFDGAVMGGPFGFSTTPCNWMRYTVMWNSGGNTSVEICLENVNVTGGGNDFAVDDIRLHEVCEREDEVTIELVEMDVEPGGPYELSCDFPVIQLDGSGSSQGPGYFYQWETFNGHIVSGANTLFPVVDAPGTYLLTVFGPGGCEEQVPVEVYGSTDPPELTILPADTISCGVDSVRLSSLVLPQQGYYRYTWRGPGGYGSSEELPWVRGPGVYYLTVTDHAGCESVDSVRVVAGGGLPAVEPGVSGGLSCALDTARLLVGPGAGGQEYRWSGPGGFASEEPEPVVGDTGWYFLRSWLDPACPYVDSVYLGGDFAAPAVALSADSVDCSGDSASVRAAVDFGVVESWRWRRADGTESGDTVLRTAVAGWHYVLVRYDNGCERMDSVRVAADSVAPVFTLAADSLSCLRDMAEIVAMVPAGTQEIRWTGPGGFASGRERDTVGRAGWYFAEVRGANGCTAIDSVQVDRSGDFPSVELLPDTLDCVKSTVTLDWQSDDTGLIFFWTGPGGFASSEERPQVSAPGVYLLELTNGEGCSLIDSVRIGEDIESPVFSLRSDSIDCAHPEAVLSVQPGGGAAVQWFDAGGTLLGTDTELRLGEGGSYRLLVTGSNGCAAEEIFTIKEDKRMASLALSGDTIDCRRDRVWLLLSRDSLPGTGRWEGPGIVNVSGDSALVSRGGRYSYHFTGTNGCVSEAELQVAVDTTGPAFQLLGDSLLHCAQGELALGAEPWEAGWTAVWRDSGGQALGADRDLIIDTAGSYLLTVTDPATGCTTTKRQRVIELPPLAGIELESHNPGCDEDRGSIRIVSLTGGTGPFHIDIDGRNYVPGESIPLPPGQYRISVTDSVGCRLEATAEIADRIRPAISLTASISSAPGKYVALRPVLNIDSSALAMVRWSPASKVVCADCLHTGAFPDATESYTVTVTDTAGCTATATVLIRVEQPDIFIPNAFTPINKDGVNDYFLPSTGEGVRIESMEIFDRWGTRLWHQTNIPANQPDAGFDGSSAGKRLMPGVYVYRISFEMPDGSRQMRTGDLSLLY